MKISKLQNIFSKFFKDDMQSQWVISEIQKLPEKDRQPKEIERVAKKVFELAKKYPYQYQLGAQDQWWYNDLCSHLNGVFKTRFKYNGSII